MLGFYLTLAVIAVWAYLGWELARTKQCLRGRLSCGGGCGQA